MGASGVGFVIGYPDGREHRGTGGSGGGGEWGAKINANVQYFYRDWYEPKDGYYESPAGPGFGYALDEGKIKSRGTL